jgi:hypothetical protein
MIPDTKRKKKESPTLPPWVVPSILDGQMKESTPETYANDVAVLLSSVQPIPDGTFEAAQIAISSLHHKEERVQPKVTWLDGSDCYGFPAKSNVVLLYWDAYYSTAGGACTLCNETGIIDTTSLHNGRTNWCICRIGQKKRIEDQRKVKNNGSES